MASARQQFARGETPFSILANQVPEERVLALMEDKKLLAALSMADWPTDEKTCEKLDAKFGAGGAEYIAAVSKLKRALMAPQEES